MNEKKDILNYKDGRLAGYFVRYHNDGVVLETGTIINDRYIGYNEFNPRFNSCDTIYKKYYVI